MVEDDDTIDTEFAALFGLAELEKSFVLNPRAVIYANEIFDKLKEVGRSLEEVSIDSTDYRAALREAQSDEDKVLYVKMVAIKRLAVTANRNLDDAFAAIFQ